MKGENGKYSFVCSFKVQRRVDDQRPKTLEIIELIVYKSSSKILDEARGKKREKAKPKTTGTFNKIKLITLFG